jgi:hypothetical protein
MSAPLRWMPTVFRASPEERAKYELNRSRTMIIWDPAISRCCCAIFLN